MLQAIEIMLFLVSKLSDFSSQIKSLGFRPTERYLLSTLKTAGIKYRFEKTRAPFPERGLFQVRRDDRWRLS